MYHKRILASLVILTAISCSTPLTTREKGALIGGGGGAGLGALMGGSTGALVGGAAGALGGGLIGDQFQKNERINRSQNREIQRLRQRRRGYKKNHWQHRED